MQIKKYCIALLFILLQGCDQQSMTYSYLMQHPDQLRQELQKCQYDATSESCQIARKAGNDFQTLFNERAQNQEAFGQRIQQLQREIVALSKQPNSADVYYRKKQDLKILYAVVATTPEE